MAGAKTYLSDAQIRDAAKTLSSKLGVSVIKGLVAVTRGGLTPTSILSQFLEIKDIRTICLSSYHADQSQGDLNIIYDPNLPQGGEGYVFIDDLVDTGKTFELIRYLYPKSTLAVLYAKPQGMGAADVFAVAVPQDEWLVFPWESDWIQPIS